MPTVSITLEDHNRSVLSAAYHKIVKDIVDTIKIPYGTLMVLHKDIETTLTDNQSNASIQDKTNLPSTVARRRVNATITEEYNEDELTTTPVNQMSAYPIFQDETISVYVYPIYVKSDITIEFSYVSPSKSEANRIRDDIRLRLSQTRNIDIHEIDYTILLPAVFEEFICDVHTLKSRLEPTSLEEYFLSHCSNRIHPITDMSNKENTKLGVHEKQVRILGVFDINTNPDKLEHDNDTNNYKVNFTYKISMDVPRAIGLRYPPMICNKPLPSKYLSFIEDHKLKSKEEIKKIHNYTSIPLANLAHFESHRQLENRIDIRLPINIPLFDEFTVRQGHTGYGTIVSFLTDVNENDCQTLFNLKDISPYYIPSQILNFIKDHDRDYIVNPYMSFLYLGLYQEGRFFDANTLEITPDLTVKCRKKLSLYKPVRVTLSFCIDFSALNPLAIARIKDNIPIRLTMINEYIQVLDNFKTEAMRKTEDSTFYRYVVDTLRDLLVLDDVSNICQLLSIIESNTYIKKLIAKELYIAYNDIYKELRRQSLAIVDPRTLEMTRLCGYDPETKVVYPLNEETVYINDYMISDSRARLDLGGLKTVTTARVFAYRQER